MKGNEYLINLFKIESGVDALNRQGEPNINYVNWLENKIMNNINDDPQGVLKPGPEHRKHLKDMSEGVDIFTKEEIEKLTN